eukprot:CAMPEP_0116947234 /NCGR_PEP_ID=MMETSP0467-20121206/37530_1 /TAXON_ID=283647 /ORGANISM="Mesodinium pulex, Strain SPMC105" /LENGTH=43 /DNA_ID= /DNA_START= /DNA_END= /DNA_ORIENTATION=
MTATYKDGIIFGKKDIKEYLGDNYSNLSYIPVDEMTTYDGESG